MLYKSNNNHNNSIKNNNNNIKINNNNIFISPTYTFSLAVNIVVYTPSQGSNREKYFIHINNKGTRCRLWREMNTFHPFLASSAAFFPSFDRKCTSLIRQKWTSNCLFPRRQKTYYYKQKIKHCSIIEKCK